MTHITPDLPIAAKEAIRKWRAEGEFNNTFYRVLQQKPMANCQNCGDAGFVMVSFTRAGPFENVPNHRIGETITWFDGNEEAGKGWYIISRTRSFDCQHCKKTTQKTDTPVPKVDPQKVQTEISGMTKDKSIREHWAD